MFRRLVSPLFAWLEAWYFKDGSREKKGGGGCRISRSELNEVCSRNTAS